MAKTQQLIAIVDDDPSVLKALKRLLNTRSLSAKTYQSGPQFLTSLDEELPDCLIIDLQMPYMPGLEVQQHLLRRGVQIPTIFVTAQGDAAVRKRCEAMGAVAFLAKPFPADALFAAIDAAGGVAT
jgi:FixJ family two-component response regulator